MADTHDIKPGATVCRKADWLIGVVTDCHADGSLRVAWLNDPLAPVDPDSVEVIQPNPRRGIPPMEPITPKDRAIFQAGVREGRDALRRARG